MSWGTINIIYEEIEGQLSDTLPEQSNVINTNAIDSIDAKQSPPASSTNQSAAEQRADDTILQQQLADYKTQLHQAKTTSFRLQKELAIRRQVMDNQDCGILFINLEQRIVYTNPVFLKRTGYTFNALQGKRVDQVIRLADPECTLKKAMKQSMHQEKWEGRAFLKDAIRQGNWQGGQGGERLEGAEGKPSVISFKYSNGQEEGQDKGFICLLHLEETLSLSSPLKWGTQQGASTNSSEHLSTELTYDSLTRLVDRPSFQQYLEDSIHAAQEDDSKIGLLYIDLDHFKRINQIFGPGFGDKILCSVSTILQQCGQQAGADLIARLSGDEFAIILPPPSERKHAEKLSQKIMQRFRTPVNNVNCSPTHKILFTVNQANTIITKGQRTTLWQRFNDDCKKSLCCFFHCDQISKLLTRLYLKFRRWSILYLKGKLETLFLVNEFRVQLQYIRFPGNAGIAASALSFLIKKRERTMKMTKLTGKTVTFN
ncbi:MAG: diguanylate cyclase [Candidatus Electrothrix sp. MAN1_4]|nr:diguanylate cyclase [Candidatus Electrothrix sp. MAN1_4]